MKNTLVSWMLPYHSVPVSEPWYQRTWLNIVVSHPIWVKTKTENSHFDYQSNVVPFDKTYKELGTQVERKRFVSRAATWIKNKDLCLYCSRGDWFNSMWLIMNLNAVRFSTDPCFFKYRKYHHLMNLLPDTCWDITYDFSYLLFPFIVPKSMCIETNCWGQQMLLKRSCSIWNEALGFCSVCFLI